MPLFGICFHFSQRCLAQHFLAGLTPVDTGALDIGGDHKDIGLDFLGQNGAGQILVNHGFDTAELAILTNDRNPAAAAADDDEIHIDEFFDLTTLYNR